MLDLLLRSSATLGLLGSLLYVIRLRPLLTGTTLSSAWGWALAGVLLWGTAWTGDLIIEAEHAGLIDRLWYAAAVVMLCPLIAVLGAKRPGARVWAFFVLVPLLLVLGWPVLVTWRADWSVAPLEIEAPALIGFLLVVIMGTGNYFGTRFSMSALLIAAALVLIVAPLSVEVPSAFPGPETARLLGTLCLWGGLWGGAIAARQRISAERPFDRLWIDFRDYFGIVWAKRIQDRMNFTAEKEQWPLRIEMDGIHWKSVPEDEAELASIHAGLEHAFRWLLRRFADPEWIDRRLGVSSPMRDSVGESESRTRSTDEPKRARQLSSD